MTWRASAQLVPFSDNLAQWPVGDGFPRELKRTLQWWCSEPATLALGSSTTTRVTRSRPRLTARSYPGASGAARLPPRLWARTTTSGGRRLQDSCRNAEWRRVGLRREVRPVRAQSAPNVWGLSLGRRP